MILLNILTYSHLVNIKYLKNIYIKSHFKLKY